MRAPVATPPCSAAALRAGRCSATSRFVAGYLLLLPDPVVPDLNALTPERRSQFLLDMSRLGDALVRTTSPVRINYAIFGNVEPALHAHVIPRYRNEPEAHAHGASLDLRLECGAGVRSGGRRAADARRCAPNSRTSARCAHPEWPCGRRYLAYVLEQLEGLAGLRSRRMFAASGCTAAICSSVSSTTTRCSSRPTAAPAPTTSRATCRASCHPRPARSRTGYHQVPADIIEDGEALVTGRASRWPWRWPRRRRSHRRKPAQNGAAKPVKKAAKTQANASAARSLRRSSARAPARCESDRAAIRPAPSRWSRGTHRRA